MKRRLWIIRHGETDFNRQSLVQGRGINSPLNALGQAQAAAFYEQYAAVDFAHVFTSTLLRSQQTVAAFTEKGIATTALAGLDEFDWGKFEGETFGRFHHEYRQLLSAWAAGDYDAKPLGGESPAEVAIRQKQALEIILKNPGSDLLICMHGRAMRLLLCLLCKRPFAAMEIFEHSNLSLYLLEEQAQAWEMLKNNDTAHLSRL